MDVHRPQYKFSVVTTAFFLRIRGIKNARSVVRSYRSKTAELFTILLDSMYYFGFRSGKCIKLRLEARNVTRVNNRLCDKIIYIYNLKLYTFCYLWWTKLHHLKTSFNGMSAALSKGTISFYGTISFFFSYNAIQTEIGVT